MLIILEEISINVMGDINISIVFYLKQMEIYFCTIVVLLSLNRILHFICGTIVFQHLNKIMDEFFISF